MVDVRVTLLSLAVVLSSTVVVVARARSADLPTPRPRLARSEAPMLAHEIAVAEKAFFEEAEESFPRDLWSQRDDFHGKERDLARRLAGEKGVPVEDVLGAVDDDLHRARVRLREAPDPRGARAIPCKPRPFYD